jgi:CRISPR-associated exonuclease Cas4
VEVKSGDAPVEPYDGHVLQLAAYCLLVEEAYGIRPSYGILQYRDGAFTVDFTYELEADLLELLELMRDDALAGEVDRDHQDASRCANCGFLAYCEQSLI